MTEKSIEYKDVSTHKRISDMQLGDIATIVDKDAGDRINNLIMMGHKGESIVILHPFPQSDWASCLLTKTISSYSVIIHKKVRFIIEE